jgi:hypothetical protein
MSELYLQGHEEVVDGGVDLPHHGEGPDGSAGALARLSAAEEVVRRAPHCLISIYG